MVAWAPLLASPAVFLMELSEFALLGEPAVAPANEKLHDLVPDLRRDYLWISAEFFLPGEP